MSHWDKLWNRFAKNVGRSVDVAAQQIRSSINMKYYAVAHGAKPGIYSSWDDAKSQVHGYSRAVFKSFSSRAEAEAFMSLNGESSSGSGRDPSPSITSGTAYSRAYSASSYSVPSYLDRAAGIRYSSAAYSASPVPRAERPTTAAVPYMSSIPRASAATSTSTTSSSTAKCVETSSPEFVMRFDGASKGNPGPSGSGSVLYAPNGTSILAQRSVALGTGTNNRAECVGLLEGLKMAKDVGVKRLRVEGDSQLVVHQFNGVYQIKDPVLAALHRDIKQHLKDFDAVRVQHVLRDGNADADAAANVAAAGMTTDKYAASSLEDWGLRVPAASTSGVKRARETNVTVDSEAKRAREDS